MLTASNDTFPTQSDVEITSQSDGYLPTHYICLTYLSETMYICATFKAHNPLPPQGVPNTAFTSCSIILPKDVDLWQILQIKLRSMM
jgi:hypothetical protein